MWLINDYRRIHVLASISHDPPLAVICVQRIREYTRLGAETDSIGWRRNIQRLRLLAPYIWPTQSLSLQIRVIVCLLILVVGRVVNIYVPLVYKHIVDAFTPAEGKTIVFPAGLILLVCARACPACMFACERPALFSPLSRSMCSWASSKVAGQAARGC